METSPILQGAVEDLARPRSKLLLPDVKLANCVFGAFVRDTRRCELSFEQRFSHFAATPLCGITWFFEGEGHLLDKAGQMSEPASALLMPRVVFNGPQQHPTTGWNPGDVYAMIVGFYPDAFAALSGISPWRYLNATMPVEEVLSGALLEQVMAVLDAGDAHEGFDLLSETLDPLWQSARPASMSFANSISDWSQSLAMRAMMSATGRGVRQVERRIRSWTGQSLRKHRLYARGDRAFRQALIANEHGELKGADLSYQAGYCDQAHMSRQVRAQTGFSPGELMKRMENDEAFWCFRLMGEWYERDRLT